MPNPPPPTSPPQRTGPATARVTLIRHPSLRPRWYLLTALAILAIAGGLRLWQLGERGVWVDEAVFATNSRGTWQQMVERTRETNSAPLAYPALLLALNRLDDSAWMMRLPAAVCSLALVAVILALPRFGVCRVGALVAASMLALSTTQVRYAQEIREYAAGCLLTGLMLAATVAYHRKPGPKSGASIAALAFTSPLVQYGAVIPAVAMLAVTGLQILRHHGLKRVLIASAPTAGAFLAGSLLAYVSTLRYQLAIADAWYLDGFYPGGGIVQSLEFFAEKSVDLIAFTTNGTILSVVGAVIGMIALVKLRRRVIHQPIFQFALVCLGIAVTLALTGHYPFGGLRQNLFFAPVFALVIGTSAAALLRCRKFPKAIGVKAIAATAAIAFGGVDLHRKDPWQEIVDIKGLFASLYEPIQNGAVVYVSQGAVPLFRFYHIEAPTIVFGRLFRNDPGILFEDMHTVIEKSRSEFYLALSHLRVDELKRIETLLSRSYELTNVAQGRGVALVKATLRRKPDR